MSWRCCHCVLVLLMEIFFHSFIQAPFKPSAFLKLPIVPFPVLLLSVPWTLRNPWLAARFLWAVTWHVLAPEACFNGNWEWQWLSHQTPSKTSAFLRHVCFGCSKVSSPFNRWQMHYPAQTGSAYDGVEGQNRWHMSHSHSQSRRWKHAPALASCWRLLAKNNWGAVLGTECPQPSRWERVCCWSPFFVHPKQSRKGLGTVASPWWECCLTRANSPAWCEGTEPSPGPQALGTSSGY